MLIKGVEVIACTGLVLKYAALPVCVVGNV